MKRLTFFLIIISAACNDKGENTNEKSKTDTLSRDCSLSINFYGAPWEEQFTAMFNVADKYGDTLLVGKCQRIEDKDSCVWKHIYLGPTDQDSIFCFFQEIKTNFRLENSSSSVADGTKVRISISAGSNALTYVYSGLTEAKNADPAIGKLATFINSKLPKDFQMY